MLDATRASQVLWTPKVCIARAGEAQREKYWGDRVNIGVLLGNGKEN